MLKDNDDLVGVVIMKGSKLISNETIANISGKDDKDLSYYGKDGNEKAVSRDIEGAPTVMENGLLKRTCLQTRYHGFLKGESRAFGLVT